MRSLQTTSKKEGWDQVIVVGIEAAVVFGALCSMDVFIQSSVWV